jgi:hypothetical protein
MTPAHDIGFLLDVGNTLLNNDEIELDLWRHPERSSID